MFFLRNLTLLPWVALVIGVFLSALFDGSYPWLIKWLLFLCMGSSVIGIFVSYRFRCHFCGKKALLEDDGTLFGKRNYFACRCMNCGTPLKGQ